MPHSLHVEARLEPAQAEPGAAVLAHAFRPVVDEFEKYQSARLAGKGFDAAPLTGLERGVIYAFLQFLVQRPSEKK